MDILLRYCVTETIVKNLGLCGTFPIETQAEARDVLNQKQKYADAARRPCPLFAGLKGKYLAW